MYNNIFCNLLTSSTHIKNDLEHYLNRFQKYFKFILEVGMLMIFENQT